LIQATSTGVDPSRFFRLLSFKIESTLKKVFVIDLSARVAISQ
jgi:hypothetical protein